MKLYTPAILTEGMWIPSRISFRDLDKAKNAVMRDLEEGFEPGEVEWKQWEDGDDCVDFLCEYTFDGGDSAVGIVATELSEHITEDIPNWLKRQAE